MENFCDLVAESFFDGGNFVQSIDFTIMEKLGFYSTNFYSDERLNKWILIRDLSRWLKWMENWNFTRASAWCRVRVTRNVVISIFVIWNLLKIDCLLIVRSLAPHVSHAIHEEGYVERNAETEVEVHPERCPDRFWPEVARHADRKPNG